MKKRIDNLVIIILAIACLLLMGSFMECETVWERTCGDGACNRSIENATSCPVDCRSECGDGICEGWENKKFCCTDCGCPAGKECINNECEGASEISQCGDGICDDFEDQATCCYDCGCPDGFECLNGFCTETNYIPPEQPIEPPENDEYCLEMSLTEAVAIAEASECVSEATIDLDKEKSCNEGTSTWWLGLYFENPYPGCNPACVVNTELRIAEINWRCTGMG